MTLLNLITIGVPAFMMTLEHDAPRTARRTGYLREVGLFALAVGGIIGLASLTLWLTAGFCLDCDERGQRTIGLAALVMMALATMLIALRAGGDTSPSHRKYYVYALIGFGVFLIVMYIPPTATFFRLSPLGWKEWLLVLGFAVPTAGALWFVGNWIGSNGNVPGSRFKLDGS